MTEIKTEPKSPVIPVDGDCVASTSDKSTELKDLDSEKQCWSNLDQRIVTVKSQSPSGCHDSQDTVKPSTLTLVVKSEAKPDGHLNDGVVKYEPGVNQENWERIVKSELPQSREETKIPPPVVPNSRSIQYVIVPSPSGTISKEEFQRFALICKQEMDGNKVSVAIAGPRASLVSADGKTLGIVSNTNEPLNPRTKTPLGANPVKMERPEGSPAALDASLIQSSLSAYATILPGNQSTTPEPENRLPGTSLVYRTPGANNMNKNGKIKRPMNAFMVWARTYRAKMAEAFPNTTNSDVSVRLGQVWHEMTDEQKRPYYREAERIKQRHKMLYPEWSYTPSPARKKPEEPPVETAESVAHSVYWARYGGGSIQAVQQAANQLLTEDCSLSPGSTLPLSTNDQTIPSSGTVSSITNVYKPVPLKSVAITEKGPTEIKQEPDATNTAMVKVKTEKVQKLTKHAKGCPLSTEPTNSSESAQTNVTCVCAEKGQNKRQRKSRVREKDRGDSGESVPGGPHADIRRQRMSGKYLTCTLPSTDGTPCPENDFPSDPYNPFYFLNLGREYVEKADPDDVDVDSWRTYLGENTEQMHPYLHEPDYNLDVFLSEARVSSSTTSLASSDIDIVPTPLASTLDRLQKPANGKPKTKSTRNRSSGSAAKTKTRESRSKKTNSNRSDGSVSKSKIVSDRSGVSRLDTPRPKSSKNMSPPADLPPDASDLFVIKEEVIVTTYEGDEPSLLSGQLTDAGGAGDSMATSSTPKPSSANFSIFSNGEGFFEDVPTISPPGKKPCVQ